MFKSALAVLFSVFFLLHAPVQAKAPDADAGKGVKKTAKKISKPALKRKTVSAKATPNRAKPARKTVVAGSKRKTAYRRVR